jgi:hypothetical protein
MVEMEIRIDTSRDSKDDIQKLISFLQHFVDAQGSVSTPTSVPEVQEGIFSLFGDSQPSAQSEAFPQTSSIPAPENQPIMNLESFDGMPILGMPSSQQPSNADSVPVEKPKPKASYNIVPYD